MENRQFLRSFDREIWKVRVWNAFSATICMHNQRFHASSLANLCSNIFLTQEIKLSCQVWKTARKTSYRIFNYTFTWFHITTKIFSSHFHTSQPTLTLWMDLGSQISITATLYEILTTHEFKCTFIQCKVNFVVFELCIIVENFGFPQENRALNAMQHFRKTSYSLYHLIVFGPCFEYF